MPENHKIAFYRGGSDHFKALVSVRCDVRTTNRGEKSGSERMTKEGADAVAFRVCTFLSRSYLFQIALEELT